MQKNLAEKEELRLFTFNNTRLRFPPWRHATLYNWSIVPDATSVERYAGSASQCIPPEYRNTPFAMAARCCTGGDENEVVGTFPRMEG